MRAVETAAVGTVAVTAVVAKVAVVTAVATKVEARQGQAGFEVLESLTQSRRCH